MVTINFQTSLPINHNHRIITFFLNSHNFYRTLRGNNDDGLFRHNSFLPTSRDRSTIFLSFKYPIKRSQELFLFLSDFKVQFSSPVLLWNLCYFYLNYIFCCDVSFYHYVNSVVSWLLLVYEFSLRFKVQYHSQNVLISNLIISVRKGFERVMVWKVAEYFSW